LWNVKDGTQTQKLEGHEGVVTSVAFSSDGKTLASASRDKTVRLWNVKDGTQTQKLEGHEDWVTSVAFSIEGGTLASASDDKTVRLWNVKDGTQTHQRKMTSDHIILSPHVFSTLQSDAMEQQTGRSAGLCADGIQSDADTISSLELSGSWVRYDDQDLLWLPYEYRGSCSSISGDILAIGQYSGTVSFLQIR
jgi:WD40 repeat protein